MLKPNGINSWTQDRFMLFFVLAAALHALVFFGVHFGITLNPVPRLADTLDVVLVQWRSEKEPEKADYLAQASQEGGGDVEEKPRPSEPVSAPIPSLGEGPDPMQSMEQAPEPEVDSRETVALEADNAAPLTATTVEQPEPDQPSAAQLMQQSMEMASLQPEVRRQARTGSRLKKKKFISANTREYEYASYMSAWVSKVERVGNMNYPSELRQKKLHGDLILAVGINQDGSVESIDVRRSSGIREIDLAATNIVQMAAPYAPLPDNITDDVDILYITRTWRFESGFGVD
jgi:protein TonB